jgi:hypothetical protein
MNGTLRAKGLVQIARNECATGNKNKQTSTKKQNHMSKKSVFCIANSDFQAGAIVDRLKNEGFSNDDISALFPDKTGTRDFAHQKGTKAPEGIATGAGTGGVVGGALGWLAGIGALTIPGVGPFIAAGPIIAALSGAAVGATVGGIAGGLIGLGIPELEARRYEGKIKAGNILLSVHTEDSEEIRVAEEIFKNAGAQDICTTGESTPPKKDSEVYHSVAD